jgi:exonuclease III
MSIYAPTNGYTALLKDKFYDDLEVAIDDLGSYKDRVIMAGDFNARIGENVDGVFDDRCVRYCMRGRLNDNGERMLDLCSQQRLLVADNMVRPSMRRNEGAWYHLSSKRWFIIDHILISQKLRSQIRTCEVDSELQLWTDHNAVVLTLSLRRRFKFVYGLKLTNHFMLRGMSSVSGPIVVHVLLQLVRRMTNLCERN